MSEAESWRFAPGEVGGLKVASLSVSLEPAQWPDSLTSAEREVARRLVRGETYDEIAERRKTSASTVSSQVRAVFEKLGVGSASELVAWLARRMS